MTSLPSVWVRKKPLHNLAQYLHRILRLSVVVIGLFLICTPSDIQAGNYHDRGKFKEALTALNNNRITDFNRLVHELGDYPLVIYLQYLKDSKAIGSADLDTALAIRAKYADFSFGDTYMNRWLSVQFQRGRHQTYVDHYDPSGDVKAQCRFAESLIKLGRQDEAFLLLPSLWNVGKSQDKSCDPAFAVWMRAGQVTDDLAWERLEKTLEARQYQLSRYLFRFFSKSVLPSAQRMYEARRNTNLVRSGSLFRDDRWGNDALIYGLYRLARNDADAARALWSKYQESRSFTTLQQRIFKDKLYLWFALDGLSELPFEEGLSTRTLTRVIHTAISQYQWQDAHQWLLSLPEADLELPEWQYWLARVEQALQLDGWNERLKNLAQLRSYYGFLAAKQIGASPQLNEKSLEPQPEVEERLQTDVRIQLVLELFATGNRSTAKNEWRFQQDKLTQEEQVVMLHWLDERGLSDEAIFTANRGDLNDYLTVRFPKPFMSFYKRGAFVADVPVEFLLAVSRKESAFNYRAISPAGARGLMQFMLPTARATAKNHGIRRPTNQSLLDPQANIELGSFHIAELAEEFNNNRVLIASSYNAGKHNTYRWMKRYQVKDTLSFIEVIPYEETRDYVKGVLAFTLVYALREGKTASILYPHELQINSDFIN